MSDAAFCRLPAESLPARLRSVREELRADLLALDASPLRLQLRYAASPERLADLLRFVQEESACCPFLRFELRVAMQDDLIELGLAAEPEGAGMLATLARAVSPPA